MYKLLSVLILTLLSSNTSGFAIVDQSSSSSSAYGNALDILSLQIIASGVVSKGGFNSFGSHIDNRCYVSIGTSDRFFEPNVQTSPKMCFDTKLFKKSTDSPLPDAVVAAMVTDEQPALFALDYKAPPKMTPDLSSANVNVALPTGRFPAVVATDKDEDAGGVYVALHDMDGLTWDSTRSSSSNSVQTTWNYLRQLTYPGHDDGSTTTPSASIPLSPIIYKYDMLNDVEEWQTTLNTTDGKTIITAMEVIPSRSGVLVVLGSTTGYGVAIGGVEGQAEENWDGFLTIIDAKDGSINYDDVNNGGTYVLHNRRIKSQVGKDDVALGLCVADDKLYVVGSTSGKIDGDEAGGAFVMKLDIDTLDVIWKKQIVGEGIEASKCDVRGDFLYIGGSVPPSVQLDDTDTSPASNTTDVFVALFHAELGTTVFLRQVDSQRHDELVGMEIDPASSEVYFTANAWDFEKGAVNIYAMSMNIQGEHAWQDLAEGEDPLIGVPLPPDNDDNEKSNTDDDDDIKVDDNNDDDIKVEGVNKSSNVPAILTGILVPTVVLSVSFLAYLIFAKSKSKKEELKAPDDFLV